MGDRDVGTERAPVEWVPVEGCTLPTVEQPLRVAEFGALFTAAVRGVERREPGWLRLHLAGDLQVESWARELIERESACCSFFDFRLSGSGGVQQLDVRVPPARAAVLDGIEQQAAAAMTQAGRRSRVDPGS